MTDKTSLTQTLTFERSTKNKHLYTDVKGTAVTGLYIDKEHLPEPAPRSILITVNPLQ